MQAVQYVCRAAAPFDALRSRVFTRVRTLHYVDACVHTWFVMVTQKDSVFGLGLVLAVWAFRRRSRGTVAMEPRCPTDTTAVPYHRGTISSVDKRSRQEASTTVHAAQVQPRGASQPGTAGTVGKPRPSPCRRERCE